MDNHGVSGSLAYRGLLLQNLYRRSVFHYHRIAVHEALVKGADPDAIVSLLFYPKVMFGFDLTGWAFYGLTWWLVLMGLGLAFRQKDTRMLLPFFFLLIPFLGFEFGTQSLKEMIPIMKTTIIFL